MRRAVESTEARCEARVDQQLEDAKAAVAAAVEAAAAEAAQAPAEEKLADLQQQAREVRRGMGPGRKVAYFFRKGKWRRELAEKSEED